jgi:hypothetical protein
VRSFVKYVRRLNPKCVGLFQKARTSPINGMYYDNASVGHNKLGTFMTEISRMAKFPVNTLITPVGPQQCTFWMKLKFRVGI